MQRIAVLGSTGSIGTQTIEVIENHKEKFEPVLLTANSNWKLLAEQILKLEPEYAIISNETHYSSLKKAVYGVSTKVLSGHDTIPQLLKTLEIDIVLNALVGFSGFRSTYSALNRGIKVALANKESLVTGGRLITSIKDALDNLIPVDSEHSAIYQCLIGESSSNIEKIILTASGGPFRDYPIEKMNDITVEQALKHPNWSMGNKITIDSATMMNKGFEIIEAKWLFDLPLHKIDAVIHPQSIIHSIITFIDGSSKAQLGPPDMMVPIQYALSVTDRWYSNSPRLDWSNKLDLTFRPIDENKFPCLRLARESLTDAEAAPLILNASNEIAVERFLNREIPYIGIPKIVERCLEQKMPQTPVTMENIEEIDREVRFFARSIQI